MKLNTEKYINTLKLVRSKINKEINTVKKIEGDIDIQVQESSFYPKILYNLSNVLTATEKYYHFNFSIFKER